MEITITIVNPDDVDLDGLDVAPIALGEGNIVGVHVEVDSDDVAAAIAEAVEKARKLGGTIARVSASNGTDAGPPLVGVSEIALMKGCQRQYASQLGKRRDFPLPIATLRGTPVWDTVRVALWLTEDGKRRVGRASN